MGPVAASGSRRVASPRGTRLAPRELWLTPSSGDSQLPLPPRCSEDASVQLTFSKRELKPPSEGTVFPESCALLRAHTGSVHSGI